MNALLPHLPGFAAAYAILLVAASSPGPAVAMLLGIGAGQGRRAAMAATVGIATGGVVLNAATLLGVGVLLAQAAWAMTALRLAGAAYLGWLAWGAFRKAAAPPPVRPAAMAPAPLGRQFLAGFALQVTNPKAVVFWIAIASVGATEGGGPWVVAAFVAGAFAISLVCHGAWALALSSRPVRAAHAGARRWIEGALGVFFGLMAFKLATARS